MYEPLSLKTLKEAKSEISNHWRPEISKESESLEDAAGDFLAGKVNSKIDLPPFDRAVYDGYALKGEDTFEAEEDNPVHLEKIGEIHAGDNPDLKVGKGECVRIATGAVIPDGANAVTMIEHADEEEGKVKIRKATPPQKHISKKGSEIKKGEKLGEKGKKISPQLRGALHGAGIKKVEVFKRPKVGVISTGEEIVSYEKELEKGQLYDMNGPAICEAIENVGGKSEYLGIVGDDISKLKKKISDSLSYYDFLITSGGSSAGSRDLIPEAIEEIGDPGVIVHGLAQKPGKPTLIAIIEEKPIFGLPGYPVSALMVFDQLVRPYIQEFLGGFESRRRKVEAVLSEKILSAKGRRQLSPVELKYEEDEVFAKPLKEGSSAITSLVRADGYFEIGREKEILERGEVLEINLFGGGSFV